MIAVDMYFFHDLYQKQTESFLVSYPWCPKHFDDIKMKHERREHNMATSSWNKC